MLHRHAESFVDGRGQEVDDPFITGRAARGVGMTIALVDDVLDVLADYFNCNTETILIILFAITFAFFVELFCVPDVR